MSRPFLYFIAALAMVSVSIPTNAQSATGYHLLNTFKVPGDGGWDYITVSQLTDRLYVSHRNQVNIISKSTGADIAVIENTEGVHGIALAPQLGKGFISNGRANTVTVFDLKSNKTLAIIKTGENPDAIMYDHFSRKVFVCNGKSRDLTIINAENNHVEKTLDLDGKPETAVSDDNGLIYINLEDRNEMMVVNANTYFIENRWKIGAGKSPTGLAIDKKTRRLFIGCGNKTLVVLNTDNGHVIDGLPIGKGCDGVVFDPKMNFIFASCGEGVLTIIKEHSPAQYEVMENATTKKGARTLALDESTHRVYLPTADFGAATSQDAHGRPSPIPGTFQVLEMGQ